jgi:hypothetical protein
MKAQPRAAWLVFAAALLCTAPLFGQNTAGSITGVVNDAQGAIIADAKVSAVNQEENVVITAVTTNREGVFVFNPLKVGTYTIIVEASGFKSFSQKNIALNVNDNIGLPPIVMTVGSVSESVTVEANAVALETVSATRAAVVNSTQLQDLPIQTRTNVATAYLREIPGNPPDSTGNFNGQRVSDGVNQLDGVTMMDAGNNGVNYSYSIEAIGEVKVSTNAFSAEYGRSSGYQVASVIKSGTSSLHGSGFWFHKNEGLNANSFTNNMQGIQKPLSRDMLSGFTVGGPIWMPWGPLKKLGRQKAFFFTSFEFHPSKTNTVVTLTVPTAAQATGNFAGVTDNASKPITITNPQTHQPFPGNVIPPSMINPSGQALLNLLVAQDPVNVVGQPLYNHLSTLPVLPSRIWDDIYKFDYNISDKHRVAFHLLRYHNTNDSYGGLNTVGNVDWSLYNRPDGEYSIAVNFVSVLSPSMTNEFNFGRSYNYLPTSVPTGSSPYLKSVSTGWGGTPVLYPGADSSGLLPGFNFAGSNISNAPFFGTNGLPYANRNPIMNFTDNVTKVIGTHTLKAGIFVETAIKYQTATADVNGTYNFTLDAANPGDTGWGYSNALLGNFDTYTQASKFLNGEYHYENYEWYVQDSWKARSNLTINYGLRMVVMPPWHEAHNQVASFEPGLYDPKQAVVLFQPFCSNGASSCSGSTRVARNPLTGATLPSAFIGTEVPGVGNRFNGATQAGTNGLPNGMIDSRGVQWAPRFGFSWSPFGAEGKWVVRGGGGVSYSRLQGNSVFNQLPNPPNLVEASLYYGNISDLNGSTPLQAVGQSTGLSRDGHIPTVYSYNFGIQRELPWRGLLDVAYVGTISNHLIAFYPYNNLPLGSAWLPQNQDPTLPVTPSTVLGANALPPNFYRPYLGFAGQVNLVTNNTNGSLIGFGSNSNYNGLQVSYQKRLSNNIQIGTHYTWSKALGTTSVEFNNGSAVNLFGNPLSSVNARAVNYGPLAYDRRNALNIDVVYNLPSGAIHHTFLDNTVGRQILSGWQISAIGGYASGPPQIATYNLQGVSQTVLNQEITGSADIAPRARLFCNPMVGGPGTQAQYINTSCIQPALKGSIGADSGVGAFIGLGYRNWDASIMKKFQLGGDSKRFVQLRFETYNVFNHTEWSGINLTPTFNPTTGAITNLAGPAGVGGGIFGYGALNAVRAPRNVQIGAKINF